MSDDAKVVQTLLGAAQVISPTGPVQEAFAQSVRSMQRGGYSERQQILVLIGLMEDGLRHGNWPVQIIEMIDVNKEKL